ncbi:MAG TPA: arginine--tRNA ligase [Smithellaceae bacterium]|nr:arginine--tRNA ligase [Smithellaceae bacterium]HRS88398.1 arginine--tRNA ligase [Smithellaceae bacterium]HRV25043.1 arginine--tRNA ligase [Smithellaceae bacterium]
MKDKIIALMEKAVDKCVKKGTISTGDLSRLEVEIPANPQHGDYAANAALILASVAKQNPRKIAEALIAELNDEEKILEKIQVAGPGFINFYVKDETWKNTLKKIEDEEKDYGRLRIGENRKVQVEFVSANPTGPLHIGHARGAVVGDVIANIFKWAGYNVTKEYYINDAGNQMNNLGMSVYLRYRQLSGEKIKFPENCYQGEYIKDIAASIFKNEGDKYLHNNDEENTIRHFTDVAGREILADIKKDLSDFGVSFDEYFHESELYKNDGVKETLKDLEKAGFVYSDGETLWFKTTQWGDEKDRVVVRKSGEPTYFAADIAYHQNKYARGFEYIIDVWGADHHGYIPRMYAGIMALGHKKESLKIVLVQLVNLLRAGQPVAMSTRSGEFVTLREVLDEVGKDAARYNFLMRRSDSHLDFDMEIAKKQSNENPVYYVQYAHARICSIIKMAQEKNIRVPNFKEIDLSLLKEQEEMQMIKMMARFPEFLEGAVRAIEPHRLTFYLNELASVFHSYYNKNKVISDNGQLTDARLFLIKIIKIVLGNALTLLGVGAPEKM